MRFFSFHFLFVNGKPEIFNSLFSNIMVVKTTTGNFGYIDHPFSI